MAALEKKTGHKKKVNLVQLAKKVREGSKIQMFTMLLKAVLLPGQHKVITEKSWTVGTLLEPPNTINGHCPNM